MRVRRIILFAVAVVAGSAVALFVCAQLAIGSFKAKIVAADDAPAAQVVIVPGASVLRSGEPSDVLEDRLLTALDLYAKGSTTKLLLSGDHGRDGYDEVNAMRKYMLEAGVRAEDIFLDHAGFDTYDTMYRAKTIFGVETALIATQRFHLPRALYIGTNLGMDVYGVAAERQAYRKDEEFAFRERFANVKAYLDILRGAQPKYGGATYDILGDGTITWDDFSVDEND